MEHEGVKRREWELRSDKGRTAEVNEIDRGLAYHALPDYNHHTVCNVLLQVKLRYSANEAGSRAKNVAQTV